jgi:hypothetical protein
LRPRSNNRRAKSTRSRLQRARHCASLCFPSAPEPRQHTRFALKLWCATARSTIGAVWAWAAMAGCGPTLSTCAVQ